MVDLPLHFQFDGRTKINYTRNAFYASTKSYKTDDNHNAVLLKKDQTYGKSTITHIGTVYLVRQDKPIFLPNGTAVKPPGGIQFNVILCDKVLMTK